MRIKHTFADAFKWLIPKRVFQLEWFKEGKTFLRYTLKTTLNSIVDRLEYRCCHLHSSGYCNTIWFGQWHHYYFYKQATWQHTSRGWRNGSTGKSTGCSNRGPGFCPQYPHGDSLPPVTLSPGDLKLSSGFSGHQTHVWCTAILRGKTPIYIKLKQILKKKTLQFTSKSYSQVNVVIHYLFRSFKNTPVGCCSETIHGVCDCSRLPLKCCHGMKL